MSQRLFYLILLMPIILGSGCHKACKEKDRTYYPIPDDIARYFPCHKPGSYWVMKNSATGKLDTVFLTKYVMRTYPATEEGDCVYMERIEMDFTNKSLSDYGTAFKIDSDFLDTTRTQLRFYIKYQSNEPAKRILNHVYGCKGYMDECKSYLSEVTVSGKSYQNVLKFDFEVLPYPLIKGPFESVQLYFDSQDGLIKMTRCFNIDSCEHYELTDHVLIDC